MGPLTGRITENCSSLVKIANVFKGRFSGLFFALPEIIPGGLSGYFQPLTIWLKVAVKVKMQADLATNLM